MIQEVQLKFGPSQTAQALQFVTPGVTIFVGPNNSGKSLALREIAEFCNVGRTNEAFLILDRVVIEQPAQDFAEAELARLRIEPRVGQSPNQTRLQIQGEIFEVGTAQFKTALADPNNQSHQFASWSLHFHVLSLDGPSRVRLVDGQSRGNLLEPRSAFQRLYTDDLKREELRDILHDAFASYFLLEDATSPEQIRIRYSKQKPTSEVERSHTKEALNFIAAATPIEQFSDGVKAFTGILMQIVAGEPKIITLDEPEAFLHPSLAFKLGYQVSKRVRETGKRLFAATHSPQFVMGAIQSGAPINIVRLTHTGELSTARLLPNDQISSLMRNPLLRSVGVISALFYDYVIVTEGDSDRAFYSEVNERLLNASPPHGVQNALFLNAQSKQSVPTIIAPLRDLGIPAAGIVDLDVLKDGGDDWAKHVKAASIPPAEYNSLSTLRKSLHTTLTAKNSEYKRAGGIGLLEKQDKEAAQNLFEKLSQYGYFVVPGGEVESWLPSLDVPRTKGRWLPAVFEKMGENPTSSDYMQPGDADVWAFIEGIRAWLTNPHRKGIPQ